MVQIKTLLSVICDGKNYKLPSIQIFKGYPKRNQNLCFSFGKTPYFFNVFNNSIMYKTNITELYLTIQFVDLISTNNIQAT